MNVVYLAYYKLYNICIYNNFCKTLIINYMAYRRSFRRGRRRGRRPMSRRGGRRRGRRLRSYTVSRGGIRL